MAGFAERSLALGRPELPSFGSSEVATLHEANKLLWSMRRTAQLPLRIFGHRGHKVAFIAYRKLPGLAELTAPATGGYIVFFCWRGYFDGDVCALVPIAWSSHKLQRICRSSLGAEIRGISSAQDELDFCRLLW